jgi:hypothetical protein
MRKTNHFQERQGYTMEYSTTSNNFYRHSGKVPLLGLILLGVAGLVAVPILGVLYGYLIFYIPFIYVNLFVVFGYVYAVSFVLSKAMRLGKIRNTLIAGLAAFGFGLLAEYVGWVAWIAALISTFLREPLGSFASASLTSHCETALREIGTPASLPADACDQIPSLDSLRFDHVLGHGGNDR